MGFGVLLSYFGKVTSLVFKWVDNSVVKLVSDVIWPLHCAGNDWWVC